jgi:ribosome-binding ATPase
MIIGLVGKPSAGKSTFFKAATLADVDIANYPFTTIEPNKGFGFVRVKCVDKEFSVQCTPRIGYCENNQRFVPVELIDVAGLVPGAHEGKGRGNKFLDDLRPADVLIHVIDVSGSVNEKGEPVEQGSYDPAMDVLFLEEELDMWYLSILNKGWEKFSRRIQQEKSNVAQALAKQLSGLNVKEDMIKHAMQTLSLDPILVSSWGSDKLKKLAVMLRQITKPIIIAANKIDVPGAKKNFVRLQEKFPQYKIIGCSAESELALKEAAKSGLITYIPGSTSFAKSKELNERQEKALEFIDTMVLPDTTGVQEVLNTAVFDIAHQIVVFPGGVNNFVDSKGRTFADCFLLNEKSTALDFAFKIHSDLGEGFIRAIDVRTRKTIGKEHEVRHRDVIEIIARK